MTKASSETILNEASDPRTQICHRIAEGIKGGAYGFQFRFITHNAKPVESWCYVYHDHQWHKRDDLAFDPSAVAGLFDELEVVAKRAIADNWSCRRIEHADRIDFELKFHREPIDAHGQNGLQSYVSGLLFHGHHDTDHDARRRIRFQGH